MEITNQFGDQRAVSQQISVNMRINKLIYTAVDNSLIM